MPCSGDAASGSSQKIFGSGSLLLAPLSNFRAGSLPTTVSLPQSHKPTTDSLPESLAACAPSHTLSSPLYLSTLRPSFLTFLFLQLAFLPTTTNCLSVAPALSFPEFAPLPFLRLCLCALWIIGLQFHPQHLNHVMLLYHFLSSAHPILSHSTSSLRGLSLWLHVLVLHFCFNYPPLAQPRDIYFCTDILLLPNAPLKVGPDH